ncbi:HesA/MoeB/ThiF family protein [Actinomadura rugatobispora]|uniref:HesA/MoeB/ThiF family protein n=1 Tax=Actinomadura rugatobispora TaxID=1994 RepID=A0ABW0ZVB4_9ACTN|nr:hypothetical protein GCM10010200_110830 [Actinomadura rugatobispora]
MAETVRHLVFTPAALAVVAQGNAGPRFRVRLRDQGDLGVVDGAPGDDLVVLPADSGTGEPGPDEAGLLAVCRVEDGGLTCRSPSGEPIGTTLVPAGADAFDRVRGIFETDVLRDKGVAVLGLGSGGSFIVRELAKAGVGRFLLLDHDRLEVGNISRHECGLDDVGRLKVNALRDLVRRHHSAARIVTSDLRVSGETWSELRELVRALPADVVICATDNRESRLLINRLCLEEDVPLVLGGVFRRAYGGVVQRVVPGLTACYQCFVSALPEQAGDNEISSGDEAARVSYTDRTVQPQPGLSTDILPIALHMAKLALVELLDGESPAFASLSADLVAPVHQWINRRELAHAGLEPMGVGVDRLSVLRWYGVLLQRLPDCRACSRQHAEIQDEFFGAPS